MINRDDVIRIVLSLGNIHVLPDMVEPVGLTPSGNKMTAKSVKIHEDDFNKESFKILLDGCSVFAFYTLQKMNINNDYGVDPYTLESKPLSANDKDNVNYANQHYILRFYAV